MVSGVRMADSNPSALQFIQGRQILGETALLAGRTSAQVRVIVGQCWSMFLLGNPPTKNDLYGL